MLRPDPSPVRLDPGRVMPAVSRLLIVEGDAVLRGILLEQLSPSADFDVTACDRGGLGRATLRDEAFDVVLTDAALPDMAGRQFVVAIREDGFRGPVVMLIPAGEDQNGAADLGVTDCVARPFKFAVLLARIRAQVRAHEASDDAAVPIGPYLFHPGAKTLTSDGSGLLRLTEKEAAILRFLHRAGEAIVSRDRLLQEVWGYNPAVTTHTLETHIYRLRQKMETDPSDARILVTETGGYRLMP